MVIGLFLAILAGSLVGLQNIFNSKVNEKSGSQTTTTLVLGMGFLASLVIGLIIEGTSLFDFQNMKPWYWFSGFIGVGVVTCLVQGVKHLGPTYAISIALASQLLFAVLFDSFGIFGLEKVPFTMKECIGVIVIMFGMILFKLSGESEKQKSQAA
ncbi:DMT family transporter [Bacillus sp. OAE603]|uniref:DMT family transporter n=1 Tax=Gottfriedia sp. OAE603 TaxID=2663872 RepID=UPI00178BA4A8